MTEIVVAGNVVEDETSGGWTPGGPSLYAARMAAALTSESATTVTLVTCLPPDYDRSVLAGLNVIEVAARSCPRYRNRYAADGTREQYLLGAGEPLDLPADRWPARADVLLLAPALNELQAIPPVAAPFFGVSLQGVLRAPAPGGRVRPIRHASIVVRPLLRPGAVAFFSAEDTTEPDALAAELELLGVAVFLTRGPDGVTLSRAGTRSHYPAVRAIPIDPTGAGDAFAATFMVRLAETGDISEATDWALAAGALATETSGPLVLPRRTAILQRLAEAA